MKYSGYSIFVLVLYEKLPVFCYRCGMLGHGEENCSFASSHLHSSLHVPSGLVEPEQVLAETEMQLNEVDKEQEGIIGNTKPS